MQKISANLFEEYVAKCAKSKSLPNSPFGEAVKNVIDFMGETDYKNFAKWCGRLRKFKKNPAEINDLIKRAKGWEKNPRALFNKLIK